MQRGAFRSGASDYERNLKEIFSGSLPASIAVQILRTVFYQRDVYCALRRGIGGVQRRPRHPTLHAGPHGRNPEADSAALWARSFSSVHRNSGDPGVDVGLLALVLPNLVWTQRVCT